MKLTALGLFLHFIFILFFYHADEYPDAFHTTFMYIFVGSLSLSVLGFMLAFTNQKKAAVLMIVLGSIAFVPLGLIAIFSSKKIMSASEAQQLSARREQLHGQEQVTLGSNENTPVIFHARKYALAGIFLTLGAMVVFFLITLEHGDATPLSFLSLPLILFIVRYFMSYVTFFDDHLTINTSSLSKNVTIFFKEIYKIEFQYNKKIIIYYHDLESKQDKHQAILLTSMENDDIVSLMEKLSIASGINF